ncbi:hypothetical protein BH11BAC2_BH11BAC2_10650 [soil metagenome]
MEIKQTTGHLSIKVAWILAVLLFLLQFIHKMKLLQAGGNFFSWDIFGYYLYLPFTFIYKDIALQNQEVIANIFKLYDPSTAFYQAFQLPNHNWMPGYTIGLSLLYAPFFLIAHLWASFTNYPQDGFSFPYQFCVSNGMIVYIIAGIFLLRKVLLNFFSDKVTAITLIIMYFGTNNYQEIMHDSLEPHAALFAFYALLFYLLIKWYKEPNYKKSIMLGLTGGLMVEIRGSEILLVFITLLWDVKNKTDFIARLKFYLFHYKKIIILFVSALFIFLPQFLHWKYVSGDWYFDNYQSAEGFNFLRPHLVEVLFSFKKSLFVYTPVLLFAVAGLFLMRKRTPGLFLPVTIFLVLNTYLLSCWLLWWNATSFGLRYMVESYAVFSIPMAVSVERILYSDKRIKYGLLLLISFLIFLNIFQTWQADKGIIHQERMTAKYYAAVFLKTKIPTGAASFLELDRNTSFKGKPFNEILYSHKTIGYFNFDDINSIPINSEILDTSVSLSSPNSCRLDINNIYSPTLRLPYSSITKNDFAWLRLTLHYYCDVDLTENPASLVLHAELDGTGRATDKYEAVDLEKRPFKKGAWNTLIYDYQTPYPFSRSEPIVIYVWLRGNHPFYIDDFKIDAYELK